MRLRFLLTAAVALFVCAGYAPAQTAAADSTTPALAPGDLLRITVWRKPELSGEFAVGPDGNILHPLYRDVQAVGVPMTTVEARVMEYLRRLDQNPQFVVEPLFRVAVGGEVRKPDLYSLAPSTTLAQAVAMAGGPAERGRLDHVTLLRGGRHRLLDLTRPEAGAGSLTVRSGDQIVVARRVSLFRDYIAPSSGLVATLVSIIGILTR
jgi:polysaccharide export outer membrane protein